MARFLRAAVAMTNERRLAVFSAFLFALPLVCAPCCESRAETTAAPPPGAVWGPNSRPITAFFRAPPGAAPAIARPAAPAFRSDAPPDVPDRPAIAAGQPASSPGESCRVAILRAAARYGIPRDLMLAISLVESGRTDPATGTPMPFPWTANLQGQDYRFDTAAQAASWVRQQQARGFASIDTGCMQVNLKFHPDAFATAEEAFDPARNADYAARFLRSLYDGPAGGDWMRAAGFYHSQTPELADHYRGLVETTMKGTLPSRTAPASVAGTVPGGGQFLTNHAELARVIPLAAGQAGRGLDAYRARPIPLSGRAPGLRVAAAQSP
jgi:hypothetical protein